MATQGMLFVELQVSGCRAEIWLNDIPLGYCRPGLLAAGTWSAQSFVVDGLNALQLVIEPGPEPAVSRETEPALRALPGARAAARLAEYQPGAMTGSDAGRILLARQWLGTPEPRLFPVVETDERDLGPISSGPWVWQRAAVLDSKRDEHAIRRTIRAVHDAFAQGDGDGIVDLAAPYLKDEARAFPVYSAADLARSLAKDVGGNRGRQGWVTPLDEESYSLRLCAGDRLVECVDKGRLPLIRTEPQPDGECYPLPVFLGKVSGRFSIVR